jgi:hypothetical protein
VLTRKCPPVEARQKAMPCASSAAAGSAYVLVMVRDFRLTWLGLGLGLLVRVRVRVRVRLRLSVCYDAQLAMSELGRTW